MSRHAHHANRRHPRSDRKPQAGRQAPAISEPPADVRRPTEAPGPSAFAEPATSTDSTAVPASEVPPAPNDASATLADGRMDGSSVAPNGHVPELRPVTRASMRDESADRTGSGVQPQPVPPMVEATACTAPQLRRFIKSRAYVPMHELRRRFGLSGEDDDVTGVEIDRDHRVFVGLPNREGNLLGDLFRAGDVGYELSLDPISPIVVGVFPMRPIARG